MPTSTWSSVATVTIDENVTDRVFTLGIAEGPQGRGRHLILQSSLDEPTAQDRETRMDSYCIVWGDQHTVYGGVQHVELRSDGRELIMRFSTEAAQELNVQGQELRLTLQFPGIYRARLSAALRRGFRYGNPEHHPTLVGF